MAAKRLRHQQAAHRDLLDIWSYTSRAWDVEQADTYLTDIDQAMQEIAAGELIGSPHENFYRKRRVGAHVIFYREDDREVVIVRVLHVRMDSRHHLPR